jgi:hypothetical protein
MIRTLFAAAVLSVLAAPPAAAFNHLFNSVWGAKGNDTGGIIPWSPENEANAFQYASDHCARWGKYPVATSLVRRPGDYIAYKCVWDPPGTRARFELREIERSTRYRGAPPVLK